MDSALFPTPTEPPAPGPTWPITAVVFLSAAGLGLLGYRYGVLSFDFDGSGKTLLVGGSIGALFGAGSVRRAYTGSARRPSWLVLVLAAALGLAVAAGVGFAVARPLGYLALRHRDLMGLTIGLAGGDEAAAATNTHELGKITIKRPGGHRALVALSWEPGELFTTEDLDMMGTALASALEDKLRSTGKPSFAVGELPTQSLELSDGDSRLLVTVFLCGGRRFMLMTMSNQGGLDRLHRRTLASARCQPGAARAADFGVVPVVFELPAGWGRAAADPGSLQLAGPDGIISVRSLTAGNDADQLSTMVEATLKAVGLDAKVGARERRDGPHGKRDVWPLEIKVDGESAAGWVSRWRCSDDRPELLALAFVESEDAKEPVLGYILAARCTAPGEAAPTYPVAAPEILEKFGLTAP